jgi:WD40 repeat protein
VKVVITKGGELVDVIDTKTDKEIMLTLRSGVYELELKDAPGLKLDLEKATLRRGEKTLATIERVPKQADSGVPKRPNSVRNPTDKKFHILQRVQVAPWSGGSGAAVSPDGKYFAACREAANSSSVYVWDGKTGKLLHQWEGWSPGFSIDGKLFVYTQGGEFKIFDVATWKHSRSIRFPRPIWGHDHLPNSRYFMAWTADHQMHLLDLEDATVMRSWPYGINQHPRYGSIADGRNLLVKPEGERNYQVVSLCAEQPSDEFVHILGYDHIHQHFPIGKQAVVQEGERGAYYPVNVADGERSGTFAFRPHEDIGGNGQFVWRIGCAAYPDGTLRAFDHFTGEDLAILGLLYGETPSSIRLSPNGRFICLATHPSVYLLRLPDPQAKDKP